MNQSELLTYLTSKYTRVGSPTPQEIIGDIDVTIYTVAAFKVQGDNVTRINVGYMVFDKGQPGETAYWVGREPETGRPQFLIDVEAFIQAKITDGTVHAAFITETNLPLELAQFRAWKVIAGAMTIFEGVFYRQANGQIAFRLEGT